MYKVIVFESGVCRRKRCSSHTRWKIHTFYRLHLTFFTEFLLSSNSSCYSLPPQFLFCTHSHSHSLVVVKKIVMMTIIIIRIIIFNVDDLIIYKFIEFPDNRCEVRIDVIKSTAWKSRYYRKFGQKYFLYWFFFCLLHI